MIGSASRALVGAGALLCALAACTSSERASNEGETAAASAPAAAPAAAPADSAATTTAGGLLDPNSATKEQLTAIPGLDAALADSVIAKRPYGDMLAVDKILAGRLGEAQRDTVYTRMFKPLDLNTAKADEITLIPGVGNRMRHEFEEYRPYKDIAQFRREIGKYVDEAEVARLERYVAIR